MGIFGNKNEGGLMDVIRCDEHDYLIWKWSPSDKHLPTKKENAIRYGSSLRVKDGEVAVFVYRQPNGVMQDFIKGPYDDTIKTANFPILSSIVGVAFGGHSPFQAEVYFINLAENIQMPFFVDKFDVADPRFPSHVVPVEVKGSIMFKIDDYTGFIKKNRMISFEMDKLETQIKPLIKRCVINVVSNAPNTYRTALVQIETKIEEITTLVEQGIKNALNKDFALHVSRVDLEGIKLDKESNSYKELKLATADAQFNTVKSQEISGIANIYAQQRISAENLEETLRIQREETQRAQKLQTETVGLSAHQINVQGDVAKTAAQSLGQLGSNPGASMGAGGGMNPAAMMTGMMMGTAVGGGMSNMMGNMMQGINQPQPPAPPQAAVAHYHIAQNGQQSGPYTLEQLRQFIAQGALVASTYIWKQGMGAWDMAANVPEVVLLFAPTLSPPPPPPPPPMM